MWKAVDVFERRNCGRHHRYFIAGTQVSEGRWKREYIEALEAENEQLHAKLAQIFDIL